MSFLSLRRVSINSHLRHLQIADNHGWADSVLQRIFQSLVQPVRQLVYSPHQLRGHAAGVDGFDSHFFQLPTMESTSRAKAFATSISLPTPTSIVVPSGSTTDE